MPQGIGYGPAIGGMGFYNDPLSNPMGGGLPMGGPPQMQLGSVVDPFHGTGGGGGGFGGWIRDPANQQLIAQIMSGIGNVYTQRQNRKLQRDKLNEEKRQHDDMMDYRYRGRGWLDRNMGQ